MSEPYLGEIRMFGFGRVPQNWKPCDGSLLSIAANETLFSLIGTVYGGDGVNTFALPDLRGRVSLSAGAGPGLSPYVLGQIGGTESVVLTSSQMPAHTHFLQATTQVATEVTPSAGRELGALSGDTMYLTDISGQAPIPMDARAVVPAGDTQPHDNLMPTLPVQFCIAVAGVYPQPS